MVDTAEGHSPKPDWRFAISVGLAIGVGMTTQRALIENLEPKLGSVVAYIVSLAATAIVAALVALISYRVFKPGEPKR